MKPISAYFITPPINTELTESDVSNQVSGANIQAHVVPEPEVCLMKRLLMKDLMQTFYMLLVMNI